MMGDFVEVSGAFALTVSAKKADVVCPYRVKCDDDANQSGRVNVTNRCNNSPTCHLNRHADPGIRRK